MKAIKQIEEKYAEYLQGDSSLESCEELLTTIESTIPEFFSRNGEAEGLHKMYEHTESELNNSTITSIDVKKSSIIYEEYLDGMKKFIKDIEDIGNINESVDFEEKLNTVKGSDVVFIESLFGGSMNEASEKTVTEATENIEYLIDFIPRIEEYKEMCEKAQDSLKNPSITDTQNRLIKESLELMHDSISNYCQKITTTVFETYNEITKAINNIGDTKNTNGEEAFVLV